MAEPSVEKVRKRAAINAVIETNGVLLVALRAGDADKAHEAVSIMLMKVIDLWGPNSVAFSQFFPVMDLVQRRIAAADMSAALRQSDSFDRQLLEIRALLAQGKPARAGCGSRHHPPPRCRGPRPGTCSVLTPSSRGWMARGLGRT